MEERNLAVTVRAWHKRTRAEKLTVENLLVFCQKVQVLSKLVTIERGFAMRNLASLLEMLGLHFRITAELVDALLRPFPMYETQEESFQFFLSHYHEHAELEKLIRRSMVGPLRIRVVPVLCVDGDLVCWIFDPWDTKVFTFSVSKGGKSKLLLYTGQEHPFSTTYQQRVRRLKAKQQIFPLVYRDRIPLITEESI